MLLSIVNIYIYILYIFDNLNYLDIQYYYYYIMSYKYYIVLCHPFWGFGRRLGRRHGRGLRPVYLV